MSDDQGLNDQPSGGYEPPAQPEYGQEAPALEYVPQPPEDRHPADDQDSPLAGYAPTEDDGGGLAALAQYAISAEDLAVEPGQCAQGEPTATDEPAALETFDPAEAAEIPSPPAESYAEVPSPPAAYADVPAPPADTYSDLSAQPADTYEMVPAPIADIAASAADAFADIPQPPVDFAEPAGASPPVVPAPPADLPTPPEMPPAATDGPAPAAEQVPDIAAPAATPAAGPAEPEAWQPPQDIAYQPLEQEYANLGEQIQAPQYAYPPEQFSLPSVSEPKKPRRGLIIGLIVGLVVLLALGAVVAFVGLGIAGGNADKAKIGEAEKHFGVALSSVEKASKALQGSDVEDAASAPVKTAEESLKAARKELATAKAAIEGLDDSQGKTDYLDAIAATNESLAGLQAMVTFAGKAVSLGGKVSEGSAAASKANEALNDAIDAGNAKSWPRMKNSAAAARGGYAMAGKLFREAHVLDKSAGLDKAAAWLDKRKQEAELIVAMAQEGADGHMTAYNADIDKMNAFEKQAQAIGDPEIVKDPEWAAKRLETLNEQVAGSGKKADDLHVKALNALGFSE